MPTDRGKAKNSRRFFSHPCWRFLFLLSVAATAIGTGHRVIGYRSALRTNLPLAKQDNIAELEGAIQQLESAIHADSVRHTSIQKVLAIMNHYSWNMPALEKFEKHDIANAIYQASVKYSNLDIALICATITQESGKTWNPRVVSPVGAMGLMQVMPATARFVAKYERIKWTSDEEVLFNPVYNIRIGCRHLSGMMELFNDTEGALAAYNGGEHRASLWLRQGKAAGILWAETQNYFPSVLKFTEEFRLINR
ncbi:MAG TPA: transglycosylase SLT domain-containing protein [bacterium]|jgi:soluble lytic murein transglycosylase-like protein